MMVMLQTKLYVHRRRHKQTKVMEKRTGDFRRETEMGKRFAGLQLMSPTKHPVVQHHYEHNPPYLVRGALEGPQGPEHMLLVLWKILSHGTQVLMASRLAGGEATVGAALEVGGGESPREDLHM